MSSVEKWRIREDNHSRKNFFDWVDSEEFKQLLNDEERDNRFVFR